MSELRRSDYYYDLPKELIAQDPLEDRSSSRLLVMNRETGEVAHKTFKNIIEYINPGDCLVLNNTKVIPARLLGQREKTGGAVELLLLKRISGTDWETLVRPGKSCRPGQRLVFGDGLLKAEILEVIEGGNRIVRFEFDGIFEEVLDKLGEMPLPPYITHKLTDPTRYNTVYAKFDGSAAAPTAGLHFTDRLFKTLDDKGIKREFVTLHVGGGTFLPVKEENVEDHKMHAEYGVITPEVAERLNQYKKEGRRILPVGTTSLRLLESASDADGILHPFARETSIFITPGYQFKFIDALFTNFHTPESTLFMLVSALAGLEEMKSAYKHAVEKKYHFFSYGDACLIEKK